MIEWPHENQLNRDELEYDSFIRASIQPSIAVLCRKFIINDFSD